MAFIIIGTFKPGAGQRRLAYRVAHIEYMIGGLDRTVAGGPLLDEGGEITGMFVVLDVDSHAAAAEFIGKEPYSAAGLFSDVTIKQTRVMTPEPETDFLRKELARQLEDDARGA